MTDRRTKFDEHIQRAYAERGRSLRGIARRAGHQEAEDIVQEAFLKVVETSKREEIRTVDNLLSRVVRCIAIDRLRQRGARLAVMQSNTEEIGVDNGPDPERALMGTQRLRQVMATIEEMPSRRREVFLLHRIEDLTYPQIARQTGISIKAVEKHIRLALRQLAENDD